MIETLNTNIIQLAPFGFHIQNLVSIQWIAHSQRSISWQTKRQLMKKGIRGTKFIVENHKYYHRIENSFDLVLNLEYSFAAELVAGETAVHAPSLVVHKAVAEIIRRRQNIHVLLEYSFGLFRILTSIFWYICSCCCAADNCCCSLWILAKFSCLWRRFWSEGMAIRGPGPMIAALFRAMPMTFWEHNSPLIIISNCWGV